MTDTPENGMEEQSFEELFEEYSAGMSDSAQIGDKVTGTIISIGKDGVFLDIGTKVDGVTEKDELLNEDGEMAYAEGDSIELFVVGIDSGGVRLSRALSGAGGLELLSEAFDKKLPVDGKVTGTCKGGLNVDVLRRRAFCPVSQIDTKYVENAEDYVGQTFQFQVTKLTEGGRNVVVSRRVLLEEEQKKAAESFLSEIETGTEIEGTVTRLAPFGAFVELVPGLEGLVHISELGWARVESPEAVVSPGDRVKALILSVEPGDKGRMKISLSMKQALPDPWATFADDFSEGDKVTGKVTRCAKFGAFVDIAPGIEGLVHISELSYTKRVLNPEEIVKTGETVSVLIKGIDTENKRVSLSLRDAVGDPWLDVETKFKVGQTVSGTVEKIESFGLFVNLEPGITGLLPKSKISRSEKKSELDKLKPGDNVAVVIDEMKLDERKISLGTGDEREAGDWKKFAEDSGSDQGMGLLGQKLQAAMKKK